MHYTLLDDIMDFLVMPFCFTQIFFFNFILVCLWNPQIQSINSPNANGLHQKIGIGFADFTRHLLGMHIAYGTYYYLHVFFKLFRHHCAEKD